MALHGSDITCLPGQILFQWHVTDRCNLQCSHCYQEDTPQPEPAWADLLKVLDQFIAFIRSARRQHGGTHVRAHVTVTGGEPFLRADFMDLLERLSGERRLFSFAVLTNGTTLTPAIVRSLHRLRPGFVQVSIDGKKETHDRIRGRGSYERAVDGLRLLAGCHIPAHISFTAHRLNYRDFPDVSRLGHTLGAARVWADRLVPCGRTSGAAALLTPGETREFFGLMRAESRRGWLRHRPVALHRSLQFMVTGARPYRCSAGDTLMTVLPNGDVLPCRRMPLVVGNLFREDLEHLYTSSQLLRELRDRERVSSGCEHCFYARTCGGGSRCIAYAVHGEPFRADPGCWLAAKEGAARSAGDQRCREGSTDNKVLTAVPVQI